MIALTSLGIALGCLIGAIYALVQANKALDSARDRQRELEDKMLILAGRPEAVNSPSESVGSVSYMDERREAELDATNSAA